MSELKPCPFCGSKPELYRGYGDSVVVVKCENYPTYSGEGGCVALPTVRAPVTNNDWDAAEPVAIAAWNTRPSIAEGVPEGWVLASVTRPTDINGISADYYHAHLQTDTLRPASVFGRGPTPESAIADAASKARGEK